MRVPGISQVTPFKGMNPVVNVKKENEKENNVQTNPMEKAPMPSAKALQIMFGMKTDAAKPVPGKYNDITANQKIEQYPQVSMTLKKEDRANLVNVLKRGDEHTANVEMQLEMVESGDVEASTLRHYWATGKMNDNLANDLDMIYEARKAGKNVADVYVPNVKTKEEGMKNAKVGDVFKVEKERRIYVKTDENESTQLNMDKKMFMKLFPPAKRFTTEQQSIGDCYLVSTLGALMENPKTRVAIYDSFKQDGQDVKVKLKNGYGEYKYENAELPADRVKKYSLKGAPGIKILEDAYGLDSVDKADYMFQKIMNDRIAKKVTEYVTAPADKKDEAKKSLDGHQKRLDDYLEAKSDPNRTIVACRDDNFYNIYYEEDENGLKFSDLSTDPDNKDRFKSAADFYRGSLGGYNFEVLQRFGFGGFRQYNLDLEENVVKEKLMQDNFNDNFVMTGGTRASGSRVENPVATSAGIYGFHAYTLKPFKDENGELKINCTNPWNTSFNADITYDQFKEYYDSVSIMDVNSYGKNLPLEDQPVPYGKNGAITDKDSKETPVTWYITK